MYRPKPKKKSPDAVLLILTFITVFFGILMVYNASVVEAFSLFSDKYHFLKLQAIWATLGLAGLLLSTFTPLPLIKKVAPSLLLVNIFLLIIVLIPGIGNKALGARRWINLGGFSLQPTELIKLTLTVYLASWLSKNQLFWHYLSVIGVILGLVMLQPDLGTSLVIVFIALLIYYASGAPLAYLLSLGSLGTVGALGLVLSSPYRKARLMTFLNPENDPLGSSYHVRQALVAIGSGSIWGLGLGQSRQKYQFLPQVTTDSIFAIISEELGFFRASLVILLIFSIVFRGLIIAKRAPDSFSRLLAIGISGWIGFQAFVNLGAMLALLPLTGLPLPFISYGGSSLIVMMVGVGLLLNISRYQVSKNNYNKRR